MFSCTLLARAECKPASNYTAWLGPSKSDDLLTQKTDMSLKVIFYKKNFRTHVLGISKDIQENMTLI